MWCVRGNSARGPGFGGVAGWGQQRGLEGVVAAGNKAAKEILAPLGLRCQTLSRCVQCSFFTRKEWSVSAPRQITCKVGIGGRLCNQAPWLSPRLPVWRAHDCAHSRAIQKYFVTLLVGNFLNVILNLQKRETSKCRLSTAALSIHTNSCTIQSPIVAPDAGCYK